MATLEKKNFDLSDHATTAPHSKVETVTVGGKTVMKSTFQPGWKWSLDLKPTVGDDACRAHHFGYQLSGRLHVVSTDGAEMESGPGDVIDIPPGHDAWVVGNDPVVLIDFGNTVPDVK